MLLSKEDVRAAGGIVHSDGNVFFTNIEQLNAALLASQLIAEPDYFTRQQFGCEREFCEKPFTTDWTPLYTRKEAK
jgi:hypothetical protein